MQAEIASYNNIITIDIMYVPIGAYLRLLIYGIIQIHSRLPQVDTTQDCLCL